MRAKIWSCPSRRIIVKISFPRLLRQQSAHVQTCTVSWAEVSSVPSWVTSILVIYHFPGLTFLPCFQCSPSEIFKNFPFMVLLAMAVYTGVTVNFLGKRFGDWRFSWSYILGWVAMLLTFFAGKLSAKRIE
ncbi:hypothetical protein scyTo_0015942 [Scyliorhinus torazame]|uniref:Uncharacterized protein n=1 Tax=Scyliorhinus torazame TaxID=75743 RepID=A0A401Q1C3_SCYTO|nr:hypothetical protein [Scyliorhinus torazame]